MSYYYLMIQNDQFNKDIVTAYSQEQPYREIHKKPVMLSFSAVPGSGKTTLAKKLFHDLQAQYINHDDIRTILAKRNLKPAEFKIPPISKLMINQMILHEPNKFIILDASIDRSWKLFFEHAQELHAHTLVIRINISKEEALKRLQRRDGANSVLIDNIDTFKEQFNSCRQHVKADINLGEDYDYEDVLASIKEKLGDI